MGARSPGNRGHRGRYSGVRGITRDSPSDGSSRFTAVAGYNREHRLFERNERSRWPNRRQGRRRRLRARLSTAVYDDAIGVTNPDEPLTWENAFVTLLI